MNGKLVDTNIFLIEQKHKIKLPDAIISGIVLVGEMELITANVADFSNIEPSYKIYNPLV